MILFLRILPKLKHKEKYLLRFSHLYILFASPSTCTVNIVLAKGACALLWKIPVNLIDFLEITYRRAVSSGFPLQLRLRWGLQTHSALFGCHVSGFVTVALVVEFHHIIFDSIIQTLTFEISNPELILNNQK